MAVLTDDEKRIVEWLERKEKSLHEQKAQFAGLGNYMEAAILDLSAEAMQCASQAIRNGDHRKD